MMILHRMFLTLSVTFGFCLLFVCASTTQQKPENYAVIVSSSRYWFNYRHASNAFSMYELLKEQGGFTDDHIILMVADDYSMNPRNPVKNAMYNTATDTIDGVYSRTTTTTTASSLVSPTTIIDYRSEDVTVDNLLRVLTGRGSGRPVLPLDKNINNVLLYLTGHGGDQFFKFQDVEEIVAAEIAQAVQYMPSFARLLIVADTCQAFTLGDALQTLPNKDKIAMVGSSLRGQSSYAHAPHSTLGLAVIEKYTHYFVQRARKDGVGNSVYDTMVKGYPANKLGGAEIGWWDSGSGIGNMSLAEFFSQPSCPAPPLPKVREPLTELMGGRRLWELLTSESDAGRGSDRKTNSNNDVLSCSASTEDHTCKAPAKYEALEPNDSLFLTMVVCFVGGVVLASQRW